MIQTIIIIILLIAIFAIVTDKINFGTTVYWFHSHNCGHCKKMKHDWYEFERLVAYNPNINAKRIDVDDPNNEAISEEFQVFGVPMIVKVINGKKYTFQGERTASEILKWASEN